MLVEHGYASASVVSDAHIEAVLLKVQHQQLGDVYIVFNNEGSFIHDFSPLGGF